MTQKSFTKKTIPVRVKLQQGLFVQKMEFGLASKKVREGVLTFLTYNSAGAISGRIRETFPE